MTSSVASALQKFSNCRILVVGDMILDAYVYGETLRVSREAPVLVVRKESKEYRLGGAANTALNLRALGAQVEVVTGLGADSDGAVIRKMLQEAGMDIEGIVDTDTTTPVKTRVMAGAAGTARQQVIRLDDEPEPLPSAAHDAIASVFRNEQSMWMPLLSATMGREPFLRKPLMWRFSWQLQIKLFVSILVIGLKHSRA